MLERGLCVRQGRRLACDVSCRSITAFGDRYFRAILLGFLNQILEADW
jgi:hypothetical protein